MVTIADAQILLPIIDCPCNQSRANDVLYARLQCTLDFAPLLMFLPYPTALILWVLYYLELSQGTQVMVNGDNVNYNLTLYLGPANLCTMTLDDIRTVILDACLQTGPVVLKASDFNLVQANTDSTEIACNIETKILKFTWPQICCSVFGEICLGCSNHLQAVLEHIHQTFTLTEGNVIMTPVFVYYQRIMNAMRSFSGQDCFLVSVCNKLIDGLDPRLLTFFRKSYPTYGLLHNMSASFQCACLPVIRAPVRVCSHSCPRQGQQVFLRLPPIPRPPQNSLSRSLW